MKIAILGAAGRMGRKLSWAKGKVPGIYTMQDVLALS